MTRSKKRAATNRHPRFVDFRCPGTTHDGVAVTREAMKVRLFPRRSETSPQKAIVVIFKGRGHGGAKGSMAGVFYSIAELAALELAARTAREKLQVGG